MKQRPYQKTTFSLRSGIVFGMVLISLGMAIGMVIILTVPSAYMKADNLAYRAKSYYRQMFPPPRYLPTPSLNISHEPTLTTTSVEPLAVSLTLHEETATPPPTETTTPPPTSTNAPSATPTPFPTPTITPQPLAERVQLATINHQYQTWNNCGPATITMYMSHYGSTLLQTDAATFLKPNRDDKNVSPQELADYAKQNGYEAIVRRGGDLDVLKTLLNHDIPVLVETWFDHDGDEMGHYRLVTGYDDAAQEFDTFDSYNGPHARLSYQQFAEYWRVFNHLYIVIYPAEQADTVAALIGSDMDDTVMYEAILKQAEAELATDAEDKMAYFNRGEALTRLGRYEEAVLAFDEARQRNLHWRRLWYQFTPFEAYYAVGRYQDVLDLGEAIINSAGGLEEGYYYVGLALHATGQAGAAESFEAALEYNPNFNPAREALQALEKK